jgi:hypothetical protein
VKVSTQCNKGAQTVTVRIPLRIQMHGGRKLIVTPDGSDSWAPPRARVDNTVVKALARAHRWRRLLETGEYASVSDLAKAEQINKSYLCRLLRRTLLAPDLIEAILDGRSAQSIDQLTKTFPACWIAQRRTLLMLR